MIRVLLFVTARNRAQYSVKRVLQRLVKQQIDCYICIGKNIPYDLVVDLRPSSEVELSKQMKAILRTSGVRNIKVHAMRKQ